MRSTQNTIITDVSARIAEVVKDFCITRLYRHGQPNFHADDLRDYVSAHVQTAPASADRILRDLRARGEIGYTVTNRRKSLYQLHWA